MTCFAAAWLAKFFCLRPPVIEPCPARESCSICLSRLKPLQGVVSVGCGGPHFFHEHCISSWYQKQRELGRALLCPLCQQSVSGRLHFCVTPVK